MTLEVLRVDTLALWAVYAAAVALSILVARRYVGPIARGAAILLALLPLVLIGKAMILGRIYGPADLYGAYAPWRGSPGVSAEPPANPILSDLAFANLPWRAAVREAVANGRFPFWNRFVLGGNPLLAAAQAGVFHPATWLGIFLPLPLSWTFSCAFTLFLGLLAAYLFLREIGVSGAGSLVGAAGWGFSTNLVFWNGWSVGPSTAVFPLLLLGLRRLARSERGGIRVTVAAFLLCLAGGHPETLFHSTAAGGVFFVAELVSLRRSGSARRALGGALAAGVLAVLLAGPQLFPLLEAIPHSAEYRLRRAALDSGARSQSVPAAEAARRLLPAALPFAHGIYGKSPVQAERRDGSGMPLAYAGAVLFPLAVLGALRARPGRALFLIALLCGLMLGASAPGLMDVLTRLPGFALALNYRLVFLASFGLAGLAALGADALSERRGGLRLAAASALAAVLLAAMVLAGRGLFRDRALPDAFVWTGALEEIAPLVVLAALALLLRSRPGRLRAAAIALLVLQRGLEMAGTYPAPAGTPLQPAAPGLEADRLRPARVVAAGHDLRPNGAALFGLEDVRGYESILLDRFADTFPLWCVPQPASFNRVDDLGAPFLTFLAARFAVAGPAAPLPSGWSLRTRTAAFSLFENPRALPRAFAPARVLAEPVPARRLSAMAAATDFSADAWVDALPGAVSALRNPAASVSSREAGSDLVLDVASPSAVFVATSLPDWPGWRARGAGRPLATETVNHAFVGVWVPAGRQRVRLSYVPPSFVPGVAAAAFGIATAWLGALFRRRRRG